MGVGAENYNTVGGGDNAFAEEYSVAGWFKWMGAPQAQYHNVFRFTLNNKADN